MLRREPGSKPYGVNHQADGIGYNHRLIELYVMAALLRDDKLAITGEVSKLNLLFPFLFIDALPLTG